MKFLILLFWLSGCVLSRVDTKKAAVLNPQDLVQFEKAFQALGNRHFAKALPVFKTLADQYKNTDLGTAALYNLAGCYKGLGFCVQAVSRYKDLLNTAPVKLKPRIYLQLSTAHECLGEVQLTLKVLKKGLLYIHLLPIEERLIEYPARLALAYLRAGDLKTGRHLQQQVHQNMEKIKNTSVSSPGKLEKNFARYFYLMGKTHIQPSKMNLKIFLNMAAYYQFYLVEGILLFSGHASGPAEQELGRLYRKIWLSLKQQTNKKPYEKPLTRLLTYLQKTSQTAQNKKLKLIARVLTKKTNQLLFPG